MSSANGNAVLVNALSSSVRSTLNGIETVPGLIRRVLEEGSWRSFTTPRGELVNHDTFESFITTAPTKGLGKTVDEIVRIVSDDVDSLALLAAALGVPAEALLATDQVSGALDPVAKDAHDFGTYAKSGGWIFGLMVARSVEPGKASGDHRTEQDRSGREKVSAAAFALQAGCSVDRVMRFRKAWERAARSGVVPAFEELVPGQDVDLPKPELWAEHFTTYERSTDRRESIAQQAEIVGSSFAEAMKVAERPGALRTAILGDAKTAEAARAALADRMQDDPDLQVSMAKAMAHAPALRRAIATEARRVERAEYVRHAVEQGKARTPSGQIIDLPAQAKEQAARHLEVVNDPAAAPEAVETAFESVQAIISQAVGDDPEALTREQRAKFRKALTSTVKSIESIDPDDLIAVADDDLRESIAAAQKRINELAELVKPSKTSRLRAV
ncbi:hypothetical protein [Kitasatospora sp. NPDC056181]|uniref:hypothetical protein n=1 Tax=Kitasatospora sp. NPDC056181 TaxID=3345737 RepID=UPI0035DF7E60